MMLKDETALIKQLEIDRLEAKLKKKNEVNRYDENLDAEVIHSKKLALATLLEK